MTATIPCAPISFDWNNINELEQRLRDFEGDRVPSKRIYSRHCNVLRNLGQRLSATTIAVENAVELASGYRDFAILLLEPNDTENRQLHSEKLPLTIKCVDEELRSASGKRNWLNTCILDIRPYRSQLIQNQHSEAAKLRVNEIAYEATKTVLEDLQPDVLLICQSSTRSEPNDFARSLSSSIGDYGHMFFYKLKNGKKIIAINGFHPMYATQYVADIDLLAIRVRKAALRFAFLQAINVLQGRFIKGAGIPKLQNALYGTSKRHFQLPHLLLPSGKLNPNLDDRFKGVTLAKNASSEFRRVWEQWVAKKLAQEEQERKEFYSILRNIQRGHKMFDLRELHSALQLA